MIQIQRPAASLDLTGGGADSVTYNQIFDGRGTLGTPTQTEYTLGPETDRVTIVDSAISLATGIDIQVNDRVVTPRGTFTVISVAQHRLHQRAMLRRLG